MWWSQSLLCFMQDGAHPPPTSMLQAARDWLCNNLNILEKIEHHFFKKSRLCYWPLQKLIIYYYSWVSYYIILIKVCKMCKQEEEHQLCLSAELLPYHYTATPGYICPVTFPLARISCREGRGEEINEQESKNQSLITLYLNLCINAARTESL